MESSAEKLRGLSIISLDEEDDEVELAHESPPAANSASDYEDDDETELALESLPTAAADYEDDEEDEEEPEVILGFLEKPKRPGLLLRHLFPSKAGGIPAWLDPVNFPSGKSICCGFCGEPLQFVLQIYAPIEDNPSAFHRTLFMFMCPSMACLRRDQHEQLKHKHRNPCRSVKVFRCQLPRTNAFYASEPPKRNGSDKPLCAGAPVCHWCGTWKGDKICSSCKIARYCSEKHQALHWRTGHKNGCLQIISSSDASNSVLLAAGKTHTPWPEFEIENECEDNYISGSCDENNPKSSLTQKHHKPDETEEPEMDDFEADAGNKCWAFFQERVMRAPKQVLRYCRQPNAKPLWALTAGCPSNADIPSCSYCKGPLCYEFQIMPQLLYYFGVQNEADSLDWATIVVYTCQGSCDQSVSYKEEFPWVQLYPTTTTRQ